MPERYVTNADGEGWLMVRHANGETYPPLPQFLRVNLTHRVDGRDHFIILEGRNRNKRASVSKKGDTGSYLAQGNAHTAAAIVKFDRGKQKLWYGPGLRNEIDAKTSTENKVPLGTHDLEIPYEVHSLGSSYTREANFAKTWFRVGHSGDRFLHCGRISAGCVTVTSLRKWDTLYNYLIKARKNDHQSVGTIEIVET